MSIQSLPNKISIFFILLLVTSCDNPKPKITKHEQIDKTLCQFSEASCRKEVNGVELSLLIDPKTVPSEQNLTLKITSNTAIKIESARIEGRDMFMGVIPIRFNLLTNKEFSSSVILGTCASGYMVWRLFITVNVKGTSSTIIFDFLADND